MRKPVRPRWHALTAGALAVSCSSTPPPVTQPEPHTQAPPPAVVAIDTSAVAAPASLVALVRFRSARGFAQRLGEKLGLRELVRGFTEQLPSALGDDEVLAHAIDLDAPADVMVYEHGHAHLRAVFSFGAVAMPAAEDAFTHGHRLTPVAPASSGVRRIERTDNADDAEAPVSCVLAPAGGDDPHAARIVCAEHYNQIAEAQPYLTRTLPRTPLAADAGDLVLELAAEQLRAQFADDLREAADGLPESVTPAPDPNNAQLQAQVRTWAREYLATTLTQGLHDLGAARLSLRFTDAGATLRGDLAMRALSAPLMRDLVASARDAHPSTEVLGKLPPGGSMYVVSAGSVEPFHASMGLGAAVVSRLLVPGAALPAADATALRTALVNLASGGGYDHFQSASTMGVAAGPAGAEWHLNVYQLDAPALPFVTNLRATVAALRRPAVARAVQAEWHLNPTTLRTLPTPGLPAGSLLVQMPVPAALPAAVRAMLHAGPAYELLAVPDGNTLWVAYGSGVLARYREARAAHAAPAAIEGMTGDGVVLAASMAPGGLARMLSRVDPQMGRVLERGFANAAPTPMLGYFRARAQGEGAEMSFDLTLPDSVLGAIGGTFRQGSAPSSPP